MPHEGVSMEPGMMQCQSITAILVNLKGLASLYVLSDVMQKKKSKKKFTWTLKQSS